MIGLEAAEALCASVGGTWVEIGPNCRLIRETIGADDTAKLHRLFGGGRVYIPQRVASPSARHAEIRRLRTERMTVQAIARRMRVSERQVYNVLAKG